MPVPLLKPNLLHQFISNIRNEQGTVGANKPKDRMHTMTDLGTNR